MIADLGRKAEQKQKMRYDNLAIPQDYSNENTLLHSLLMPVVAQPFSPRKEMQT